MQKHVKNYFEEFGYNQFDSIGCEVCGSHRSTEIHHVEPRSSFGSKTKIAQDAITNLICLCRLCHDKAHGPEARKFKEILKEIITNRN